MRSVDDGNADERVMIFDTTLRDGEQAPGFSMGVAEKLRVAAALRDLGVDIIEAGFAAASPGDEEAIHAIAEAIHGPTICSLARASVGDIEAAARAIAPAHKQRIHIFLATSPIHREAKLKMTCAQVLENAAKSVAFAKTFCDDVEFSAEDAIRTEPEFLIEVIQASLPMRALTTLNICPIPSAIRRRTRSASSSRCSLLASRARQASDSPRMLPQRSRHGGGEQPGGRERRCAPDRMQHQRNRRARRQLRALEEVVDGLAHACRSLRHANWHRHYEAGLHQPPCLAHHEFATGAQQGGGRKECLCA